MHYTPSNLPPKYREFFLSHLYADEKYKQLQAKVKADVERAVSKLKSAIDLQLLQDKFLANALKLYGSDEAVDKFYNDNHITLWRLYDSLEDNQKAKFDNALHASLFALDLIDTYVSTLNGIIHSMYPYFDFKMFDSILALGNTSKAMLKDFHSDKKEGYEQVFADEADKIQSYIENERMPVFLRRLTRLDKKKG